MISITPFSLESLVPGFSSWFHDVHERGSQNHLCVSVPPGSRKERLREGQPELNPQILLQRSCSHGGELAGTKVLEEYGPYRLRLSRRSTPSRKGAPRSPAAALSKEHHPTERLTECHKSPTLPCSLSFGDPLLPYYTTDLQPDSHPIHELTDKWESQEEWFFSRLWLIKPFT